MKIKYKVAQGEAYPAGYGHAYTDYIEGCAVVYIMPLNKIVYLWREFMFWMCRPGLVSSAVSAK
jgi:hypothetical protein